MATNGTELPKFICPCGDCKCGDGCQCTADQRMHGCCCHMSEATAAAVAAELCQCMCEGCKSGTHCGGECKEGTCGGKCMCSAVRA